MSQQNQSMEPAYFMDLVVENVRCFKDKQVLDLSDGNGKPARWTIILGDNGTGKTTLLKCLAFLKPKEERHLKESIIIPEGLENPVHRNPYFYNDVNRKLYIRTSNLSKGSFTVDNNSLIGAYGLELNFQGFAISESNLSSHFKSNNLFIIAFGASRKMNPSSLTESKNPDPIANLFDKNPTLINSEAWLLETDFAIKHSKGETKKYLQSHYHKVKDTLKKLLPDIEDFRIREITKTQIQAAIEVKTPYGWVAMKSLSLGYQTFIAWVVDLAARLFARYPDSEKPLEEPCIVLVDEIDLHLHPKWQRKIIAFLTDIFKNAQFIVTAHSPLIVQAAEDANIVLLKREGDSVKIYNNKDEEAIKGWRIDQVLTSDLFGLDSARPPKYDADLARKKQILEKEVITKTEEKELEQIAKKLAIWELNDEATNDALKALKQAAAILKSK